MPTINWTDVSYGPLPIGFNYVEVRNIGTHVSFAYYYSKPPKDSRTLAVFHIKSKQL